MTTPNTIAIIAALALAGASLLTSASIVSAAGMSQSGSSGGKTITKAPRCFQMCTNGPVRVPCKAGQAGRFITCYKVVCSRICVPPA